MTVTVTAVGQGASQMPPTHAFLRLLVLAQSSEVKCVLPLLSCQSLVGGGSALVTFSLLSTGPTGGPHPLCCPCAAPSHPCPASFHFGDSGQSWERDDWQNLVGDSWRCAVPARLHFLVTQGQGISPIFSLPYGWDAHVASEPCPAYLVWGFYFLRSIYLLYP